uniref:Uncharacterized protein n=1 Tax=Anolis carolinensis TaxID=28377 RepID=A0A803STA0_ANOCA|nr:PREDICTED: beta-defensin 8 [Anolis carolinensis]|eukprot:XP_016851822.1 PREDICTED: beta-defensin 8 [Anolis carolinensis]
MKIYYTVVLILCITLIIAPGCTKKPRIKSTVQCRHQGGTCGKKCTMAKKIGKCDKKFQCCKGTEWKD